MANYPFPVKNTAYIFYVGLISQSNTKVLQANPTLAAGDFQVSIDGGAFANLGTLPTVTPAAGTSVKVSMASGEMNGDNIVIACIDAAGAQWCDQFINIQTATRGLDDLAYPATSGRSMVVDAAGLVDANMVKAGPTGSGTAQTARDIGATLGAAGVGLTNLGDARLADLDAAVSSRSTYAGGAVASVTGNVGGNVVGNVNGTVAVSATGLDAVVMTDLAAIPGATATLKAAINLVFQFLRNQVTQTSSTTTLFKDNSSTAVGTAATSDDGTTFTKGKIS